MNGDTKVVLSNFNGIGTFWRVGLVDIKEEQVQLSALPCVSYIETSKILKYGGIVGFINTSEKKKKKKTTMQTAVADNEDVFSN